MVVLQNISLFIYVVIVEWIGWVKYASCPQEVQHLKEVMHQCFVQWNKELTRDRQKRGDQVQSRGFAIIGFGESEGPSFRENEIGLKPSL